MKFSEKKAIVTMKPGTALEREKVEKALQKKGYTVTSFAEKSEVA